MTIKVTVTNSDSRDTAVISVEVMPRNPDTNVVQQGEGPIKRLKGGESHEQWVHSHQDLHIREVCQ